MERYWQGKTEDGKILAGENRRWKDSGRGKLKMERYWQGKTEVYWKNNAFKFNLSATNPI